MAVFLIYLRSRYYDPATGRFIQEDSWVDQGPNLYGYCGGAPVNRTDPSGHAMIDLRHEMHTMGRCTWQEALPMEYMMVGPEVYMQRRFGNQANVTYESLYNPATGVVNMTFTADTCGVNLGFEPYGETPKSFFDMLSEDFRNFDINNQSEEIALKSHYFSAYKGVLVFRTNAKRSGSFGAIFCRGEPIAEITPTMKSDMSMVIPSSCNNWA